MYKSWTKDKCPNVVVDKDRHQDLSNINTRGFVPTKTDCGTFLTRVVSALKSQVLTEIGTGAFP